VLTTLYFCIQNVQLYYIAYFLGIYAEYTEHLVNPLWGGGRYVRYDTM